MVDMQSLVGTQLEMTEHTRPRDGSTYKAVSDAQLEKLKEMFPDNRIRIKFPGGIYTMDYRTDRINVKHDGDGRVTQVSIG